MQRIPVISSNCASVGYDPTTRTLEVNFILAIDSPDSYGSRHRRSACLSSMSSEAQHLGTCAVG
ncbi:MAG: KTSC domain-containing protein [Actinobacteria bacterium]|nr:KTSC domain-containing protein [Actinomycetota bacterium]